MKDWGAAAIAALSAIVGLAIVAVLVGSNAQTPQVIQSAGSALSSVIGAAVQPVSSNGALGAGTSNAGGLLGGNTSSLFGSANSIINQGGIGNGLF